MKMKKGVAEQIFIILFLVAVLYSFWATINFVGLGGFEIQRNIVVQQDLYTMNNALEGAKLYMDTALKYSAYQAAFDYGQEDKADANKDSAAAKLSEKIKQNLNKYAQQRYTFLSQNYGVKLPEYKDVSVEPDTTSKNLKITATPLDNLKIEKDTETENIFLAKSGGLEFIFSYPLLDKIIALSPASLKETLKKSAVDEWKITVSKVVTICTDKKATDIEVFNEFNGRSFNTFLDAEKGFSSYVESKLIDLKNTLKLEGSVSPKTTSVKIDHQPCAEKIEPCNANTFKYTKICEFKYSYSGQVKIELKDSQAKYPVKVVSGDTGKISLENIPFAATNSIDFVYPEK